MAERSARIAHATRRAIRFAPGPLFLAAAATIILTGCEAKVPVSSNMGPPDGGSASPVDGNCQSRARDGLTYVAMDDFDPNVAVAISTAAETTEQSSADILDNYCLLDRNLERPGKRCFLFLTRTIQPGGEIYVCVTSDGRPTDIHLGE